MMNKPQLHVGLRTIKTALAVTAALMLCSLYGAHNPVFAGIGAIIAMTRTVRESFREVLNQFAGVAVGGVIGVVLVVLFPQTPPWAIGLGIVAAIVICNLLKITFVSAMACAIVVSACTSVEGSILVSMLYRLADTAVGLAAGIVINITSKPYNNEPAIAKLLREIAGTIPGYLETCVVQGRYPDLKPFELSLHRLQKELYIYQRERLFRRAEHEREAAFLGGCAQLATRMYQELGSISCMDSFGIPGAENLERLRLLGLEVPEEIRRKCTRHDTIVLNYHLGKLLDAREYLLLLLQEDPENGKKSPWDADESL